MLDYRGKIQKILLYFTALIAGICIFLAFFSIKLENTLFSSEFHKKIFRKNDLYTMAANISKIHSKKFIEQLSSNAGVTNYQNGQLMSLAENSLTPDIITLNIDSLLDGLNAYIKSETAFLPDIYLKLDEANLQKALKLNSRNSELSSSEITEKINTGVILMYLNRTDISDKLMVLKLLQFTVSRLPYSAFLITIFCTFFGLLLTVHKNKFVKWLKIALITISALFLISGIISYINMIWLKMPTIISTIPLDPIFEEPLKLYLEAIFSHFVIYLSSFAAAGIIITFLFYKNKRIIIVTAKIFSIIKFRLLNRTLIYISISILILLLLILSQSLVKDYNSRKLNTALDRMKGISAFSSIVYANDATIYSLEIEIKDIHNSMPIEGVHLNIGGESEKKDRIFDEFFISNKEGKIKTELANGFFKLSFNSTNFPDKYIIPDPYYFEISKPGTTHITINLEKPVPSSIPVTQ